MQVRPHAVDPGSMLPFEECRRHMEDMQAMMNGEPSGAELQKLAEFLRQRGYKVVNKNKRRRR